MAKRVSTKEMIRSYDAYDAETERVKDFPELIHDKIKNSKRTVISPLADMVVVRSGVYIPKVAKRYLEVEEQLEKNVGKPVLVATTSTYQWYRHDWRRWLWEAEETKLAAGVIKGAKPIVDKESASWAIPTDKYAFLKTNQSYHRNKVAEPKVHNGPLPVSDTMRVGSETISTLNILTESEPHSGVYGDPEDTYSARKTTKVVEETSIIIGASAIKKDYRELHAQLSQALIEAPQ